MYIMRELDREGKYCRSRSFHSDSIRKPVEWLLSGAWKELWVAKKKVVEVNEDDDSYELSHKIAENPWFIAHTDDFSTFMPDNQVDDAEYSVECDVAVCPYEGDDI
jgi:hypothetical protein